MPADLVLALIENADTVLPGDLLTYTITVANNGPDVATDVVVTDNVSPDVSLIASSAATTRTAKEQLTTALGNLAVGETVDYTLKVLVSSDASNPLSHTTVVTTASGDANLANNSVIETTPVSAMVETGSTGSGMPINTVQPYSTLNYAIALQGVFPSRNLSFEPVLGSVMQFAGNFAPRGWALANGQLLSINQNQALFSILGTTYGGNGQTTFALPDLRGRVPVGAGSAPGLEPVTLGQQFGSETVNLTTANLPEHSHTLPELTNTTGAIGAGQPFDNVQPSLGLNAVITVEGLFPSRSLSTDPYLGSIDWFAGNFAPRGTLFAQGQLLPIAQYTALFSLLGTTYGGDGRTTFALPDLRSRTPIHFGDGPGLPPIQLGETGGTNTTSLTLSNLPSHAHMIAGAPSITNPIGVGQAVANQQPYLGVNYQLALSGIFPPRDLVADEGTDRGNAEPDESTGLVSGDTRLDEVAALAVIHELAQVGIARWAAAGISAAQAAQLASVPYRIADLAPGNLAFVGADNEITIDDDASNLGWFIDATPWENEEFSSTDPVTGELLATETAALHRFDLLTAIMHEQGHILGLPHTAERGSLLYGALGTGGRLLPTDADLQAAASGATDATDATDSYDSYLSASSQYIAGVGMFGGNFAINGFAPTDGQLLSIAQNTALFSLLGTTYGGNGITTFALPDLRGRTVIHAGQGPGLADYQLGQVGGTATTTITTANLPAHSHSLPTADLAITQRAEANPVVAGTTFSYTLTVTNNGPNTAENVIVSDLLPAGVTLIATTGSFVNLGGVPTANLGDITPGNSAELTLTVSVTPTITGPLLNQATVAADTTDPDTSNNISTEDIAIVAGFFSYNRWLPDQNPNAIVPTDTINGLPLAKFFDETFYRRQNLDVLAAINAGILGSGYEHFLRFGRFEGRNPSAIYNEAFYLDQHPDVEAAVRQGNQRSGLEHFLLFGHEELRDPSALFSQSDYLSNYQDVASAVNQDVLKSAFEHYVKYGADESRRPALALYNEGFYLTNNLDVADAVDRGFFPNGFAHFVTYGQGEQRNPSSWFNQTSYLAANPDVQAAVTDGLFASAFDHYEQYGRFETRSLS